MAAATGVAHLRHTLAATGGASRAFDKALRSTGAVVLHGNAWDSWDLEVRGSLGSTRLLMAFEDSGPVRNWCG